MSEEAAAKNWGVRLHTEPDGLWVECPYDSDFPPQARSLGGRWEADKHAWRFNPRDEERVRRLLRGIYATDGDYDGPLVTVHVRVPENRFARRADRREFRVAGRQLAWRPARDWDVRLADGVSILSGGFASSGGSRAHPELAPEPDTWLEVKDVPVPVAERIVATADARIPGGAAIVRRGLEEERARLLARIEEIDRMLATAATQAQDLDPVVQEPPAAEM